MVPPADEPINYRVTSDGRDYTASAIGTQLSGHPDVDMVSFTGSTRAGVLVAQAAAPTVKRVAQELGGKSAAILLEDADGVTRWRRKDG